MKFVVTKAFVLVVAAMCGKAYQVDASDGDAKEMHGIQGAATVPGSNDLQPLEFQKMEDALNEQPSLALTKGQGSSGGLALGDNASSSGLEGGGVITEKAAMTIGREEDSSESRVAMVSDGNNVNTVKYGDPESFDMNEIELRMKTIGNDIKASLIGVEGQQSKPSQLRKQINFVRGVSAVMEEVHEEVVAVAKEPTGVQIFDNAYKVTAEQVKKAIELFPRAIGMMLTALHDAERKEIKDKLEASSKSTNLSLNSNKGSTIHGSNGLDAGAELPAMQSTAQQNRRSLKESSEMDQPVDSAETAQNSVLHPTAVKFKSNTNKFNPLRNKKQEEGNSDYDSQAFRKHHKEYMKNRRRYQSQFDHDPHAKHHFHRANKLHDALLSGDHGTLMRHLHEAHARSKTIMHGRRATETDALELKAKQCMQLFKCVVQMSIYDMSVYFYSDDIDPKSGEIDDNIYHANTPDIFELFQEDPIRSWRDQKDSILNEANDGFSLDDYKNTMVPNGDCDDLLKLFYRDVEFGDIPEWEGATVSQVCQAQGSQVYLKFDETATKISTQVAEKLAEDMFECAQSLYASDANNKMSQFPFRNLQQIPVAKHSGYTYVHSNSVDYHDGMEILYDPSLKNAYPSPNNNHPHIFYVKFTETYKVDAVQFNWARRSDGQYASCPSSNIAIQQHRNGGFEPVTFRWGLSGEKRTEETLVHFPSYIHQTAYFVEDVTTSRLKIFCTLPTRLVLHNIQFFGDLENPSVSYSPLAYNTGSGQAVGEPDEYRNDVEAAFDGDLGTMWVSSQTYSPLNFSFRLESNAVVKRLEIDWSYYSRCYSGFYFQIRRGSNAEWETIPIDSETKIRDGDTQNHVINFDSNTLSGNTYIIRCTKGGGSSNQRFAIKEIRLMEGGYTTPDLDYRTDFSVPSGINMDNSTRDPYGQLLGPHVNPYTYSVDRIVQELEHVRMLMAETYFIVYCSKLKSTPWVPPPIWASPEPQGFTNAEREEIASRYPDPDPSQGQCSGAASDVVAHFNELSTYEQADMYLRLVKEAQDNELLEYFLIKILAEKDGVECCDPEKETYRDLTDEAKEHYTNFNEEIVDLYKRLQDGFNLVFGRQASVGHICGVAEAIAEKGASRWPGSCCLDAPYQNPGDHWGRQFDCSQECEHPAPFFNGMSEGSCATVGGTWCAAPVDCVVLKECIDEEIAGAKTANKTAYATYLEPGKIDDAQSQESCGQSRQYFGFDALYTNDEDVCDNVKQLHNTKHFEFLDDMFDQGSDTRSFIGGNNFSRIDSYEKDHKEIDLDPWEQLVSPDHSVSKSDLIKKVGKDFPPTVFAFRQVIEPLQYFHDLLVDTECPDDPTMSVGNVCKLAKNVNTVLLGTSIRILELVFNIFEFTMEGETTEGNVEPFERSEILAVQHDNNVQTNENLERTFKGIVTTNSNLGLAREQLDKRLKEITCMLDAGHEACEGRRELGETETPLIGDTESAGSSPKKGLFAEVVEMKTEFTNMKTELATELAELAEVKNELAAMKNMLSSMMALLQSDSEEAK